MVMENTSVTNDDQVIAKKYVIRTQENNSVMIHVDNATRSLISISLNSQFSLELYSYVILVPYPRSADQHSVMFYII